MKTFYPAAIATAALVLLGGVTAAPATAAAPDDPAILGTLAELRAGSAEFVRMWETHDVQAQRHSTKRFRHPVVGLLTVETHVFDVRYAPGLQLIVYDAPDGTSSSDALARLLPSA